MKTQIFKNYKEFKRREDKTINGVTKKFAEKHKIDLEKDDANTACWNSYKCTNCNNCKYCYKCNDCNDCHSISNAIGYANNTKKH